MLSSPSFENNNNNNEGEGGGEEEEEEEYVLVYYDTNDGDDDQLSFSDGLDRCKMKAKQSLTEVAQKWYSDGADFSLLDVYTFRKYNP